MSSRATNRCSSAIVKVLIHKAALIPTCCLRGGCLTGPNHSGVELHGVLPYLVKCNLEGREYKVFGYKGEQLRDNIHPHDVAHFIKEFLKVPRIAEVYDIGGGRDNSRSI